MKMLLGTSQPLSEPSYSSKPAFKSFGDENYASKTRTRTNTRKPLRQYVYVNTRIGEGTVAVDPNTATVVPCHSAFGCANSTT